MMRAIVLQQPGGVEQLKMSNVDKPKRKPGELLIKVKATAINRTDIISRERGSAYVDFNILGVEVSGIVEEADTDSKITPGTRVMGLVNGGGYAEYVTMPADRAIVIPDNMTFEEAAAIPEVFLTAYQTLFWIGKLEEKETVLIHAGGSGVGTAAIQLAKQLRDANIIVTAGSKEKLDFTREIGAKVQINYKTENFAEKVLEATDGKGVDLLLDFIGASYWEKNYQSIGVDGRWVLIGILGGTVIENIDIRDLMLKRIQLTATMLTARSDEYKAALTKEFAENALPLFNDGRLKPIIDRVYSFEDLPKAHERMEQNKNIGKIIIKVAD